MTIGKTNGRRTSGQAVMNALKKAGAVDEKTAVGYDVLQKVRLTTPVLAYTIANLMEENSAVKVMALMIVIAVVGVLLGIFDPGLSYGSDLDM